MPEVETSPRVSFGDALRFWCKLGFISFGGPAGQIAIMHRELVERRRWIDEQRFLHALNFCMLPPGPEAMQLATYVGWLLHGTRDGIVAGALFVLPSVFVLLALSWVYAAHGELAWVAALFGGLQPAVIALILSAGVRIGRKALDSPLKLALALGGLLAVRVFDIAFPWIVLVALALGFWVARREPRGVAPALPAVPWTRTLRVSVVCVVLWWSPVALAGFVEGWDGILVAQGTFFSKAAMVTFGGAYAVLPYVADSAVEHFRWLSAPEMLDGLALAETTPGPLIMVVQFVGFIGGWRAPGSSPAWLAGTLSAAITTWVTFLPCFLWVFAAAPYVERVRGAPRISSALAMVSAAVVGVIANLALTLGQHSLVDASGSLDFVALALVVLALAGLQIWKWSAVWLVLGFAAIGGLRFLLGV